MLEGLFFPFFFLLENQVDRIGKANFIYRAQV